MPVHGALSGPGFRFPGPGTGRVSIKCLVVMSLALDEQRGAGQHHEADQQDVGQILGVTPVSMEPVLVLVKAAVCSAALMVPLSPVLVVS